jgi:hypothetical protein
MDGHARHFKYTETIAASRVVRRCHPLLFRLVTQSRFTEALSHLQLEEHGVDGDSYARTLRELFRMMNPTQEAIEVAEVICSRLPHLVGAVHNGETPLHICVSARRVWTRATGKYVFYPRSAQMALTLISVVPPHKRPRR